MQKMLRKLIELLPVSRRTYTKALEEITKTFKETTKVLDSIATVLEGFDEAEANHCQIEMSIIQQMQKGKLQKSMPTSTKKNNRDAMYQ